MDCPQGRDPQSVDDELQKVRSRLLKINEKIKHHCTSHPSASPSVKGVSSVHQAQIQDIPLEELRSKLRAINDYVRDRVAGEDVPPPVLDKPAPKARKLSHETVLEEPIKKLGEDIEPVPAAFREKASVQLPEISVKTDPKTGIRFGVGLDLGTAYIVASREVEDKRVFVKNERNAFLSVRSDNSTKELLTKLKIKYVGLQEKLYVLGGMALELADIFGRETQRSMNVGILNPSEAESIPIIKLLVQNILWPPRHDGEVCCFSIPAQPLDRDQDTIYHRGVFEGILRSMGYEPMVIDEGYAVVLSEMEDRDFTGIGISCGAGMVNVCAAFKSVPVMSFSITRGGDWIDKSASGVLGIPSSRVTSIKEQGMDLKHPKNREEEAIVIYYRNYIHYLLENMSRVFGKDNNSARFKDPVDLVFAGGSSMVTGFLELVKEEMKTVDFGFEVGEAVKADDPFTSVTRGCLFHAINSDKEN